jgi:hypothetical protein
MKHRPAHNRLDTHTRGIIKEPVTEPKIRPSIIKRIGAYPRRLLIFLGSSFSKPDNLPSFLSAALSAVLAWVVYYAWIESTESTKILSDQARTLQGQLIEMKAEARPWVIVLGEIPTMQPITFDNAGVKFTIQLAIKNGGKSIATHVAKFFEGFGKPLPPDLAQNANGTIVRPRGKFAASECTPSKVVSFAQTYSDNPLFPGDTFSLTIPLTIAKANFVINKETSDISIWLSICLGYMDEAQVPHPTSFVVRYITDSGADHFALVGQPPGHFWIDDTSFEIH